MGVKPIIDGRGIATSHLSALVSIVTPAYNEAEHLEECIESVLAQTYTNWNYTIVNNCSTDETLAIATKYANRDSRIRVISNTSFLPIIDNHNEAIRQILPESKYCKFVFADDWLYPACLEEMVSVAEENPSVGLVGAYTIDGQSVIWQGPPYPCARAAGREVCRQKLLGGPYLFGTMTCLLIRSDLIRKRTHFFNPRNLHADQEACFDVLLESDFGFVHQVLSFSRPREQSNGAFAKSFGSIALGDYVILLKYGPVLLEQDEYKQRIRAARKEYYWILTQSVLRLPRKEFRKYHEDTLRAFGARIDYSLLATTLATNAARHIFNPARTLKQFWHWCVRAVSRHAKGPASA